MRTFTAALFKIAPNRKQANVPQWETGETKCGPPTVGHHAASTKECTTATRNNTDEPQKHYAE